MLAAGNCAGRAQGAFSRHGSVYLKVHIYTCVEVYLRRGHIYAYGQWEGVKQYCQEQVLNLFE